VTSRVDIYDTVSQTWSTAELTQARYDISVIAVGNKIFFAGGTDDWFFTSRIDIYDVSSNTWSTAELSKARGRMAVAAIGNRVFFAGGDCFDGDAGGTMINSVSDVVDIYDISTNTWTVSHLSERRGNLEFAGTSLNNKFYVAGGFFHQWGPLPLFQIKWMCMTMLPDPGQLQLWPMQEPILEQLWLTTKYSGSAVMIFPALQTK
jgi:N-acetylneuraminic acid mutarotase